MSASHEIASTAATTRRARAVGGALSAEVMRMLRLRR
jgi:hypothetical protein